MTKFRKKQKIEILVNNNKIEIQSLNNSTVHRYDINNIDSNIKSNLSRFKNFLKKELKVNTRIHRFTAKVIHPLDFSEEKEGQIENLLKNTGFEEIYFIPEIVNLAKNKKALINEEDPAVLANVKNNRVELAILKNNKIVTSVSIPKSYESESKEILDILIEFVGKQKENRLRDFDRGIVFIGETKFMFKNKEYLTKTLKLPVIVL